MKCISIQVLVIVISLAKSLAMSFDELEDFSNYLKETSLLDQPLKTLPSDENDDVPVSDHAWEESGRFEGDLVLNERQRQLIVQDIAEGLSRNGLKDSTKRWPNNEVIVYIQREHFNGDQVQAIVRGMEELSQASCIKFRPYRKGDRDAVVVQGSRRGCFSQVGYQGGYQVLNLSGRHPVGRGCFRHGTVVHEFLHALGFYHMQSSPDRDDYIDVIWDNIVQPARHNFRKYNLFSVSDFGVGYDYDSVLHYSRKAFSSNGGDTLVPKKSGVEIGQRLGLSDKDTAKLNKMYCDADSSNFEAADDVPHTVNKKKKTPKNKPFEGNGIGYHQGKTVVFKLPAAKTNRLPEQTSNLLFDYFSQAPQAMPPKLIKGFGNGEKITYSYKLPAGYHVAEYKFPSHNYPAFSFNSTNDGVDHILTQNNIQNKNEGIKPSSNADVGNKKTESLEDFDEENIKVQTTDRKNTNNDNVYASVYKPNTDYSEYYNPVNKHEIGVKTDFYLNYSPNSKENHDQSKTRNFKLTRQFIDNLGEQKTMQFRPDNNKESGHSNEFDNKRDDVASIKPPAKEAITLGNADSPFGYVNAMSKLQEMKNIYFINPEYTSDKYLNNKHDFSSLYHPSEKVNKDARNAQYKIFGEQVPLTINYTLKQNSPLIRDETLNTHTRREDDETIKKVAEYPTNKPVSRYKTDEGYSYEDYEAPEKSRMTNYQQPNMPNEEDSSKSYEDYDTANIADYQQPTSDEESSPKSYEEYDTRTAKNTDYSQPIHKDSSLSYEVTEKASEQVEFITEKSNIKPKPQDEEIILEKRLPAILEKYVNYDNYDITAPYLSSIYDNGEYYRKT